jgi:hypothetical protein
MTLTGGKHQKQHKGKTNNALKSWVAFVKKIQKDEKIKSYKEAIHRASLRKSEWKRSMKGGEVTEVVEETVEEELPVDTETSSSNLTTSTSTPITETDDVLGGLEMEGGRHKRKTKKAKRNGKGRTRRSKSRKN